MWDTNFSFVLHSPHDVTPFIDDNIYALINMGYIPAFFPNNFDAFAAAIVPITQTMMLNLIVFGIMGGVVLLLAAFIYIRMSRKDFAIQRALGMPLERVDTR